MSVTNYSLGEQFLPLTTHHELYSSIDPTADLKGSARGKVVFLAGASQGIGRTTAQAFARAGAAAIYLTARSEHGLAETKGSVLAANPDTRCEYRLCDVTIEHEVKAAIADCVEKFGAIDVADANAGYLDKWSKIGESDPASWWRTWEVNVKGTYHVIRHAMPHLIASAGRPLRQRQGGRLSDSALFCRRAISYARRIGLSNLEARDQSPV